jgi:hypothetical protein
MKSTLAQPDRGPFGDTYPEGTKSRAFFVENEDGSTKVDVFIYFTPDGKKFFSFITPKMSDTFFAYSADEVNLIRAFLDWLAKHKDEIYPTDEHPTGLPLDDIDDCEKETETTDKGESNAELGK